MRKKKDNGSLPEKARLRQQLRAAVPAGAALETHGGVGALWRHCYQSCLPGVVCELDAAKADALARQRPEWRVYQTDCVRVLSAGLPAPERLTLVDIDAYGDPWPAVEALFASGWLAEPVVGLALTDGLRQTLKLNHGWACKSLQWAVETFGNDRLYRDYAEIARANLKRIAGEAGYDLTRWKSLYAGWLGQMTLSIAVLRRAQGASVAPDIGPISSRPGVAWFLSETPRPA